jgi:hypothetical protein
MNVARDLVYGFWSQQRPLALLVLVSLGLHIVAGTVFSVHSLVTPLKRPRQPIVYYVGVADETSLGLPGLRDPSLAALGSRYGFSASTLSPSGEFPYQPLSVDQPPRPLAVPLHTEPVRRATRSSARGEVLAPKLAPPSPETAEPASPLPDTRVVLSASLAARAPAGAGGALRVEAPVPPQATVLRVAVDGAGSVRYALITESSGSATADRRAIQEVNRWRFVEAKGVAGALDWGEVHIIWGAPQTAAAPPSAAPDTGALRANRPGPTPAAPTAPVAPPTMVLPMPQLRSEP